MAVARGRSREVVTCINKTLFFESISLLTLIILFCSFQAIPVSTLIKTKAYCSIYKEHYRYATELHKI